MFSKLFLVFAYFNSTKTAVDNSKALTLYHQPKCMLRPAPTYLDLIKPSSIKIHYPKKQKKDSKASVKNHTNLRG